MNYYPFKPNNLELLQEIIKNCYNNDVNWFKNKGISLKKTPIYHILNYGIDDTAKQPENVSYSNLCRGLVIDTTCLTDKSIETLDSLKAIKSFPFARFFNKGEPLQEDIDLKNSKMFEKMDGTMVGIFMDENRPELGVQFHTRKMLSNNPEDFNYKVNAFRSNTKYQLLKEIQELIPDSKELKAFLQDHNLMCEFIHPSSQVLTDYQPEDTGLYLLSARNLNTLQEVDINDIPNIADDLSFKLPKILSFDDNYEEIIHQMSSSHKPNFEGFVFIDDKGKRIKIKDPDYVYKHRLIGTLSLKNLVPLYFKDEVDEITTYFPHAKSMFKLIDKSVRNLTKEALEKTIYYRDKKIPQKDIAKSVLSTEKNPFVKNIILKNASKNLSRKDIKDIIQQELKILAIGDGRLQHNLPKLLEHLGLKDLDLTNELDKSNLEI